MATMASPTPSDTPSCWQVFLIFLKLGLTSFGGPIAHLAYFRTEFVERRAWLSERAYADLVALCQFLPGPASSQVGMGLGLSRAGYAGAAAAWLGFTLPSALALTLLALGLTQAGAATPEGLLQGLKLAAVAVVAQALWGMFRQLCPDNARISLMAASCCLALWAPHATAQVGIIVWGGLMGWWLVRPTLPHANDALAVPVGRRAGAAWLLLFAALLLALPVAAHYGGEVWQVIDTFYRVGALVFGGGHVVLPLLQAELVPTGWIDAETFLAGYGATQAVPGPLFTFAAFLGASLDIGPGGWAGAALALGAVFLPSFLLVAGTLPFWQSLRQRPAMQAALAGVNAAVVGLLLAALYSPMWRSAVQQAPDFGLALVALVALMAWKLPPWLVVLLCGLGGWGLQALSGALG